MKLDYLCTGSGNMTPDSWIGHITFLFKTMPYELEVTARSSTFHIICGRHKYGNYICVPNGGIGTELAGLSDHFWTLERLTTIYPELSQVDAISITDALVAIAEHANI